MESLPPSQAAPCNEFDAATFLGIPVAGRPEARGAQQGTFSIFHSNVTVSFVTSEEFNHARPYLDCRVAILHFGYRFEQTPRLRALRLEFLPIRAAIRTSVT